MAKRDILDYLNTGARLSIAHSLSKRNDIISGGIRNTERHRRFTREMKLKEVAEREARREEEENLQSWIASINAELTKGHIRCRQCGHIDFYSVKCSKCKGAIEVSFDNIRKAVIALESATIKASEDLDLYKENMGEFPNILPYYLSERSSYIEDYYDALRIRAESQNSTITPEAKQQIESDLVQTKSLLEDFKKCFMDGLIRFHANQNMKYRGGIMDRLKSGGIKGIEAQALERAISYVKSTFEETLNDEDSERGEGLPLRLTVEDKNVWNKVMETLDQNDRFEEKGLYLPTEGDYVFLINDLSSRIAGLEEDLTNSPSIIYDTNRYVITMWMVNFAKEIAPKPDDFSMEERCDEYLDYVDNNMSNYTKYTTKESFFE